MGDNVNENDNVEDVLLVCCPRKGEAEIIPDQEETVCGNPECGAELLIGPKARARMEGHRAMIVCRTCATLYATIAPDAGRARVESLGAPGSEADRLAAGFRALGVGRENN